MSNLVRKEIGFCIENEKMLKMKLCNVPITAVMPGGMGPPARVSFCESNNHGAEINRKRGKGRVKNKKKI